MEIISTCRLVYDHKIYVESIHIIVIPLRKSEIPDMLHSLMQWKLNSVHSIQSTEMQNQN